jgi:hypothetical protein
VWLPLDVPVTTVDNQLILMNWMQRVELRAVKADLTAYVKSAQMIDIITAARTVATCSLPP